MSQREGVQARKRQDIVGCVFKVTFEDEIKKAVDYLYHNLDWLMDKFGDFR
jgi:hypothetical protein